MCYWTGLVGVEPFAWKNRALKEFFLRDSIPKNVSRMVGMAANATPGGAPARDSNDEGADKHASLPFGACCFCCREQG